MAADLAEKTISILVVDDHNVVRHGLSLFLQTIDGFNVAGTAANGEEAVVKFERIMPDVVLMDLVMPGMDGVESLRQLQHIDPRVKVIFLTSYPDDAYVQKALQAGAAGYLLKTASTDEIEESIRAVYNGRPALSREATDALLRAARKGLSPDRHNALTTREAEVLAMIAEGLTNRQIADRVGLSNSTVKFHISSIFAKLGVASRAEAVAYALNEGFIGNR